MGKFQKGHKLGRGNSNSGRKTKMEEIIGATEKITSDALIALANNKVYKQLNQDLTFTATKEMALPVTLRGITEKHEVEFKPIKITVKHADGRIDDTTPPIPG